MQTTAGHQCSVRVMERSDREGDGAGIPRAGGLGDILHPRMEGKEEGRVPTLPRCGRVFDR